MLAVGLLVERKIRGGGRRREEMKGSKEGGEGDVVYKG